MASSEHELVVKVIPDMSEVDAEVARRQQPSVGRIVHYKIGDGDLALIDSHAPQHRKGTRLDGVEFDIYQRNSVHAGQVYPALVVAVFDPSTTTVNLMVQLDGYGQYWATSRVEGDQPGNWSWPARV